MYARRMCVYRRYARALPHEKASKIKKKKREVRSVKPAFDNHSNRGCFGKEKRRIRPVLPQIKDSI